MIRPPPTSTLFPYTTLFRSTTRGRESVAEAPHQSHAILDDREALVRRGRGQGHTRLEIHLVRRPHEARAQGVEETALPRSEEHTSELQSRENLVCRLLLEKK